LVHVNIYNKNRKLYEKNDLEVIKEGKTGHGILIENDGFVTLDRKQLMEGFENGEWHVPNPFIVDAVFQKFGIKNANGRIYPEGILKREVEKYQQKIDERRAYGEANHPSDSTINLSRVSHNIVELHWENATLVGKLELNTSEGFRRNGIVTTCGDEMANLLLNGYKIGVSSRGVGSVEQKFGQYLVGDDFELICWDIVSDPSTPGAYIGNTENLQQYIESEQNNKPTISEKINKIKNILNS
jgi:hypothetical protein